MLVNHDVHEHLHKVAYIRENVKNKKWRIK